MTQTDPMPTPTDPIQQPFRFGVVAGGLHVLGQWTDVARRLESAGFSSLLVPDNLDGPAPLIAAASAAAATTSLRVGTFVAVAGLRPPKLLAWEASTVQALSHGRFELGLGLGRPDAETDAQRLGIPLSAEHRVGRLIEVLDAVDELPAERRPSVLLAAGGPQMLRLAGERADAVTLGTAPTTTTDELAEAAGKVRWAARDRPQPPELAVNLMMAGNGDPPGWLKHQFGLDPVALRAADAAAILPGTPAEMADALLRRREQTGISYVTGGVHLIEVLAPVVERLAGR